MMAGQLTENVKVYSSEEKENEYGERTTILIYQTSTRAKLESSSGNRTTENNEIVYDYTKTFYVRSYVPISDTTVIEYEGKKYRLLTYEKRKTNNDIKIVTELINE